MHLRPCFPQLVTICHALPPESLDRPTLEFPHWYRSGLCCKPNFYIPSAQLGPVYVPPAELVGCNLVLHQLSHLLHAEPLCNLAALKAFSYKINRAFNASSHWIWCSLCMWVFVCDGSKSFVFESIWTVCCLTFCGTKIIFNYVSIRTNMQQHSADSLTLAFRPSVTVTWFITDNERLVLLQVSSC